MKVLNPLNYILFVIILMCQPLGATNHFSIEEAIDEGLIKLSIKGKGGYLGKVIQMEIKNLTTKKLDIHLESGRVLDSQKNSEQDIVITQPQNISLSANQAKILNIFGMCAQAHNGAPSENSDYSIGSLADSNLVKLVTFIDENNYHTNRTAQQAVWTITNNKSLASISSGKDEDISIFKNLVSAITGRPIPSYNITYRQQNRSDLMGRVAKVEGVFDYTLDRNCHATLAIYDSQGTLVQLIFKDIAHQKGKYNLYYTFRTLKLPPGNYIAKMYTDNQLFKELEISF